MLHIHLSNRAERLIEALAAVCAVPLDDPFAPEWISVQSGGMRTWVTLEIARQLGVVSNVRFPFPREIVDRLLGAIPAGELPGVDNFERENMTWAIMHLLPQSLRLPEFDSLRSYLSHDFRGFKRFKLATKIAHLFDEYLLYRPGMILQWEDEAVEGWQPALWRALVEQLGRMHQARQISIFRKLAVSGKLDTQRLPARISMFGVSSLPPAHMEILVGLPKTLVNVFLLSPTREYWADIRRRGMDIHQDEGNPLLAAWGGLGREFQQVLLDATSEREFLETEMYEEVQPHDDMMLHVLQNDILNLRERRSETSPNQDGRSSVQVSTPLEARANDRSVSIHSCHSQMREIEVLRDQLLDMFDDESLNLRPENVVVMAANIEEYVPFIDAVFETTHSARPIPYRISDRSLRAEAETVEAFTRILDLVRGRMKLQEVNDLLTLEPVRARFGLDIEEVEQSKKWSESAGIRFGIDAEHRREFGQPDYEENTWRFGLDRLLLGYAVPTDEKELVHGVLPFDDIEGQGAATLGKYVHFCESLFRALRDLVHPRTLKEWQTSLKKLLNSFVDDRDEFVGQTQMIVEVLARQAASAGLADFTEEIDIDLIRDVFRRELDQLQSARGFLSGGVTFCSLLPMRSIPFKVVCLLGMNENSFPRSRKSLGFDLMAQDPRPGDRNVRNDDRYMFLEALLAARDRFCVFHIGQSIQNNVELPPSVLVSELIDVIEESFISSKAVTGMRDQLVVNHPLQPFSAKYFDDHDPRVFSYSDDYLEGARATLAPTGVVSDNRFVTEPLHREDQGLLEIGFFELIEFIKQPPRDFLKRKLGVSFPGGASQADCREPLTIGPLDEFEIGDQMLEMMLEGVSPESALKIFRAKGVLPLGTPGRLIFEKLHGRVERVAIAAAQYVTLQKPKSLEVDLTFGDDNNKVHVTGQLGGVYRDACVQYGYKKMKPARLLDAWVRHLVLNCAGPSHYPLKSVCIGRSQNDSSNVEEIRLSPMEGNAQEILGDLCQLYRQGRLEPLKFFPSASYKYAVKIRDGEDSVKAVNEARRTFYNDYEKDDIFLRRALRGYEDLFGAESFTPHGGFCELALRVFNPLLESMDNDKGGK
jgi:exodeoxyribonuclease V gamma subunit